MTIYTVNKKKFELINKDQKVVGTIEYQNDNFSEGVILLEDKIIIKLLAVGLWVTIFKEPLVEKVLTNIKVEVGGTISIRKFYKRKKYNFKKSTTWKQRFTLTNSSNDELLTIVPTVNWEKESHDYNLQINEDYEDECDLFLILQAIHCTNCSLSMMIGGGVPALVSI